MKWLWICLFDIFVKLNAQKSVKQKKSVKLNAQKSLCLSDFWAFWAFCLSDFWAFSLTDFFRSEQFAAKSTTWNDYKAVFWGTATHCNTLQHAATHGNTLQHTATHCNTLQHTATHCNTLQHTATKVSSLLNWLHEMTIKLSLEDICQVGILKSENIY